MPLERQSFLCGRTIPASCRHLLGLLAAVVLVLVLVGCGQRRETRWTMINVQGPQGQADSHLLELPNGYKILVDAAEASDAKGALLGWLKAHKIDHLNLVVISHWHRDHYGMLRKIIDGGVRVDRVAMNLPASREIADAEKPWGCDWEEVQETLRFLSDSRIPYFTPRVGERLIETHRGGVLTALDVVCLYDGVATPIGRTDINDTSILLRLTHGPTRVLFTGDLNQRLGAWLATSDRDLKADILKMPHHGTEGLAPDEFFDKVSPTAVLVPSPESLWYSLRSKRTRDWCAARKVPAYVNGICGTVVVEMGAQGYTVKPERPL